MSNFIEEFMGSLGPEVTKQLSSNLGIKKNTATQLLPQVIPMILGGLKKQKDEQGGEARVDHILNKYGSSSVLSHLFAQGRVSGELFQMESEFRHKVNKHLPVEFSINNPNKRPESNDYQIVFAIIIGIYPIAISITQEISAQNEKSVTKWFGCRLI